MRFFNSGCFKRSTAPCPLQLIPWSIVSIQHRYLRRESTLFKHYMRKVVDEVWNISTNLRISGEIATSIGLFYDIKGTVSWKLIPCCYILLESSLFEDCPLTIKNIFIKGPVRKLHVKISAFTAHFPLKVQGSFIVLSSACSVLWKYCIFANNFCKHRQLHEKKLISICPTIFFQRTQHQWTNTLKEQCSHLNFS